MAKDTVKCKVIGIPNIRVFMASGDILLDRFHQYFYYRLCLPLGYYPFYPWFESGVRNPENGLLFSRAESGS